MPLHLHDWLLPRPDDHGHVTQIQVQASLSAGKGLLQHSPHFDASDDILSSHLTLRSVSSTKAAAFLEGPRGTSLDEPSLMTGPSYRPKAVRTPASMAEMTVSNAWLSQLPRGRASSSASSFLFSKDRVIEVVRALPAATLVPLHAASIVFSLPGHIIFELGEGYLFGFEKGLALAFTGKALGSMTAFAVGRSAGCLDSVREAVQEQMKSWPVARKAAKSVENGGHLSVFLVRIAPLPCVVKNYALSLLTEIPWTTFIPGTLLGLLPTTAAHVYAGTLAPSSTDLISSQGAAMKVVAAASTFGGVTFFSLLAAYVLRSQFEVEEEGENKEVCEAASPQADITRQEAKSAARPVGRVKLYRKPELLEAESRP
eukprot:TRINITY_DN41770_c0_g1_i1.p1 TRINITY_DN41770_c0_g1~~TRINITY_DN41770_c0_g1_i1.p1  ORF type:complete len:371 (+),score=55.87 TRINITY_DN41770_c0_g1_i1:115-1227(+)